MLEPLFNNVPFVEILSEEGVEQIHKASMRLLSEFGTLIVDFPKAVELFRKNGATIVDGNKVGSTTVQPGGTFTKDIATSTLSGATAPQVTATVTATDAAGNAAQISGSKAYTVDMSANASITLDANITPDDVINIAESKAGVKVPVTGTVGGDAEVGDDVTITVGTKTYTGKVLAGKELSFSKIRLLLQ